MVRKLAQRVLVVLALGVFAACGGDDGGTGADGGIVSGDGGHQTTGQSWTVLVYMVADNNLESAGLADLEEMASTGQSQNMRFVVQVDRSAGYTSDALPGVGDWVGTKRLLVTSGGYQVLQTLPDDPDMGSSNTLADFIQYGVKSYPADRYAIVLWDHGGAWPGFGSDDSHGGDQLSLAELKQGFQKGLAGAGLKSFSLIGFDACLMGTFEVARALAPYGEYLLASEQLEPGSGWDYNSFKVIRDNPGADPVALGKAILGGYKAQSDSVRQGKDITLSLTDLRALDGLGKGLDALASKGTTQLAQSASAIGREREDALKFGESADPSRSLNMVDIGDLATRLAQADASFGPARDQILAGLQTAVLARTNGPVTQASTGLSIYFPPSSAYYSTAYDTLTEVETWRAFLKAYNGSGSASTSIPTFVNADHLGNGAFDTGHFTVSGTLVAGTSSQVTSATFTYGIQTSTNDIILLGDAPADVYTDDSVSGSWNMKILSLSQGTNRGYGYLSASVSGAGDVSVTIPFQYQEPNAPARIAFRQIILDTQGTITQDAFYAELNGGYGELTAAPGATLMPLLQIIDSSGNTSWGSGADNAFSADDLDKNPISLGFQSVARGKTVVGVLSVANYGGKGDYVVSSKVTP